MVSKAPTLYLIDGHAQLYRAHNAHLRENRRATDGTPTGAVYGFFMQLRSIRSRFKPEYLGCVFDPKGPTFRVKEYAGYKAQRAPMPDELRTQVPLALEICEGYGIPAVQAEGFEADDVLATLARQAREDGFTVVIVTGDKDLLQLVEGPVTVFDPFKNIHFDAARVEQERGLKPAQIVDWLGLMGDHADNIPGVEGVGDQTALKLLQEHGSLDRCLEFYREKYRDRDESIRQFVEAHRAEARKEKAERRTIKPPKGMKVVDCYLYAQADQARASRELARLRFDAPVRFDPETFRCGEPKREALSPLLARLDLRQFLREMGGGAPATDGASEAPLLTAGEQKAAAVAAERRYRLVDTPEKLKRFVSELTRQKRFAFDTETTSTQPLDAALVGLSFAWQANEAWYLPVRGPLGATVLDEQAVLEALRGPLEDPRVEKVAQHAKYDLNVLRRSGLRVRGLAFDTLLAGWLLDPGALRHDLDSLAYAHLQIRKISTQSLIGKGQAESMALAPVADVARYACEDADVAWQLAEVLTPKLEAAGLLPLLREVEVPLVEVLAEMEWTGVYVDAELLREMSKELGAQLAAQEEEIYRLAGTRFTINSPRQLAQILFEKLGLPSQGKTSTGQDSTSEEVLQALSHRHELPKAILEYQQFSKLKSTYVDALPALRHPKTNRVHASFNQTGTETGRLSSSDPNLQNIPVRTELGRSIRAAFRPQEPGWKMLCADYSQIELRMLAHYSRDEALQAAFEKNLDIHAAVAARLNGVKEQDVTREQRAQAKTVNFGVLYGQTAFGLAQTLGIARGEAQQIIDRFFAGFPKVRECLEGLIEGARARGYVTTILGRRRYIPQLKEKAQARLGERLAVNTVFQGSAADLIKKAMRSIHEELHGSQGWKARMILQIHDELLFEAPEKEVLDLTNMVRAKMEKAHPLQVPLVVDTGVGADWLSAKD